ASGSTFALGTTTVTLTATDAHNNSTTTTFTITVVDTTPPVIAAHADVTVEATSAAGANVTFPASATSDAVDGAGVASVGPASGTLFHLGDTVVTETATDAHGNVATPVTFTVHVVDTTAPVITTVSANVTAEATSGAGANVSFAAATAIDA